MKEYGYCRISTPQQSIDRQERNIKAEYPNAHISQKPLVSTTIVRFTGARLMNNSNLDK